MNLNYDVFVKNLLNKSTFSVKEEKAEKKRLCRLLNSVLSAKSMTDVEKISDADLFRVTDHIDSLCGQTDETNQKKNALLSDISKAPAYVSDRIL